jgi:hypothetical protein
MALPYDDPIRPNIDLGITKLDIGSIPGHELDYLRDYFKDIVPQDLGIPSDSEPESALPETYDENDPYAGMTGRTAMINPLSIIGLVTAGLSKKQIAKVLIKNKLQKEIGKKVKPVLTGILTGGKAAAAAPTSHKEAQATGGDYHSDTRSTVDGQTTEWGDELFSRGGLAQRAPRYANGGLIDFFRYGGFIG